jgi:putative transposase
MRRTVSPATGRRYPLTMIAQVWHVARSSVYAAGARPPNPSPPSKRGPQTERSDEAVVTAIRAVLTATPFHGEGYRKVRARLAHRGLAVSGKRVLRLMRVHQQAGAARLDAGRSA